MCVLRLAESEETALAEVRNQFTFYRSYFDAIQNLNKRDRAAIILAVCEYALYETEPEGLSAPAMTAFELIRPTLDSGRKKALSGKQGGKANGKQDASKPKAKPKQGENASDVELKKKANTDVDNDTDVDGEGNASPLLALGERKNVFLDEYEIDILIRQMGHTAFYRYVERLSDFISRTEAKIYNHYATILRWWSEDAGKPNKPSWQDQYQRHDGELSELELRAIQQALQEGEE